MYVSWIHGIHRSWTNWIKLTLSRYFSFLHWFHSIIETKLCNPSLSKNSYMNILSNKTEGWWMVDVKKWWWENFFRHHFSIKLLTSFLKASTNWKWWSNNDFPKKLFNLWDGSFAWKRSNSFPNFCNKSSLKNTKCETFLSASLAC